MCDADNNVISGDVKMLKNHFLVAHNLKSSVGNATPFTCKELGTDGHRCNAQYTKYQNFQKHLLTKHPNPLCQVEDSYNHTAENIFQNIEKQPDFFESLLGIENMVIFKSPPTIDNISGHASEYISTLRCNVAIPESYIQNVMTCTQQLISKVESYLWSKVKDIVEKQKNTCSTEEIVRLINDFTAGNVFKDVKDMRTQIAHLYIQSNTKIPEPIEVVLESKSNKTVRKVYTNEGFVFKNSVRNIRETFQYISVLEILSLVMRNPEAMDIVEKETSSPDGSFNSYKDGSSYKHNPYFRKYPTALRLTLNADDIEIVNNLSPRSGKHKITQFYIKIQNFEHCRNSSYNTSYLVMSINAVILKKHGFDKVLRPLLEDLKRLESDEGVVMKFGITTFTLRAVLCSFAGDTLAAHELFGLLGPSASYFCRQCYITRNDMKNGFIGALFEQRSVQSHQRDVENVNRIKKLEAENNQGQLNSRAIRRRRHGQV